MSVSEPAMQQAGEERLRERSLPLLPPAPRATSARGTIWEELNRRPGSTVHELARAAAFTRDHVIRTLKGDAAQESGVAGDHGARRWRALAPSAPIPPETVQQSRAGLPISPQLRFSGLHRAACPIDQCGTRSG